VPSHTGAVRGPCPGVKELQVSGGASSLRAIAAGVNKRVASRLRAAPASFTIELRPGLLKRDSTLITNALVLSLRMGSYLLGNEHKRSAVPLSSFHFYWAIHR